MLYYLESPSHDPAFNLALEQVVFDRLDRAHSYCMLWQNDNAVIVGKHQNTAAEINADYISSHGVRVVRRLSGGGAVYHDLGNINFTFITGAGDSGTLDLSAFCQPVLDLLRRQGIDAQCSGRNDMTIDGQKFSGNSQYIKQGRVMHHGTILYDSDLTVVSKALTPPEDKYVSKGLASVRSRVTNVRPHMPGQPPTPVFLAMLRTHLLQAYGMTPREFTEGELAEAQWLRNEVYATWDWNFGASPAYQTVKKRRVEGVGTLEVHMDVENGVIRAIRFYGDYFSTEDPARLAALLTGQRLEPGQLLPLLRDAGTDRCFVGLRPEDLVKVLVE